MNAIKQLGLVALLAGGLVLAGCRCQPKCGCSDCGGEAGPAKVMPPALPEPGEETARSSHQDILPLLHDEAGGEISAVSAEDEEPTVRRRTFRDITAHPAFSHANDYSWLIGELQYMAIDKAWVLRYASVEDEDRYGGSVTLLEPRPLEGFQSGMIVRVEGQIIDPRASGIRPPYRLISIEPYQKPAAKSKK